MMTKSELIRKFQTFTPATPFAAMLKEEFGVDVPKNAPKYQCEYFYKAALIELAEGTPKANIVDIASKKVVLFLKEFPLAGMKYDEIEVVASTVEGEEKIVQPKQAAQQGRGRRAPKDVADGTIEFYAVKSLFQLYIGGKAVVTGTTLEKMKATATERLGFTAFGDVFTFSNGVATAYATV